MCPSGPNGTQQEINSSSSLTFPDDSGLNSDGTQHLKMALQLILSHRNWPVSTRLRLREQKEASKPVTIDQRSVEVVSSFKPLGTIVDSKLSVSDIHPTLPSPLHYSQPPSNNDTESSPWSNKHTETLPTLVEPVKEIFLTVGFSHSSCPTDGALVRDAVTTFSTPAGRPACLASYRE